MASRHRLWRASVKLWTFCMRSRSGGCTDLSHLGQIQDVPGCWKLSVAQCFISARTVIDGEQNPPSNPHSEDEDQFSMDVAVPIIFFQQRKKGLSINCCAMHQEIIEGGDKTSLTLWEGDCVSWFLWQPACMINKIFPPTGATAGCILQNRLNKHVLKGTNSRCGQIFEGVGVEQNLMPQEVEQTWKGASQHCILTTRTTGIHSLPDVCIICIS